MAIWVESRVFLPMGEDMMYSLREVEAGEKSKLFVEKCPGTSKCYHRRRWETPSRGQES